MVALQEAVLVPQAEEVVAGSQAEALLALAAGPDNLEEVRGSREEGDLLGQRVALRGRADHDMAARDSLPAEDHDNHGDRGLEVVHDKLLAVGVLENLADLVVEVDHGILGTISSQAFVQILATVVGASAVVAGLDLAQRTPDVDIRQAECHLVAHHQALVPRRCEFGHRNVHFRGVYGLASVHQVASGLGPSDLEAIRDRLVAAEDLEGLLGDPKRDEAEETGAAQGGLLAHEMQVSKTPVRPATRGPAARQAPSA